MKKVDSFFKIHFTHSKTKKNVKNCKVNKHYIYIELVVLIVYGD